MAPEERAFTASAQGGSPPGFFSPPGAGRLLVKAPFIPTMPRPVTLFTGQWADLPLDQLAPLVKKMGYDGVELACWGDHFDVDAAAGHPVEAEVHIRRAARCGRVDLAQAFAAEDVEMSHRCVP